MQIHLLPLFDTALTIIEVQGEPKVIANSYGVGKFLASTPKDVAEETVQDLYSESPELFWGLHEEIQEEEDGDEIHPFFIGKTPDQIIKHYSEGFLS